MALTPMLAPIILVGIAIAVFGELIVILIA